MIHSIAPHIFMFKGGSPLSTWKTRFWARGWMRGPGHVPTFWGWFWVHARNTAHVRPWSKKWVQKPKPKLKEIELSFYHHSIRLEKTRNLKKESQNRMKNDRDIPIRRSRAKVAVGLFWVKRWLFWPNVLRYGVQICFAHHLPWEWWANQFWSQSDLIWPFQPIKTFKKSLKWPYLKTCFFQSAPHVWSNNLGYD